MAKLECICGEVLSDSLVPSEYIGVLIGQCDVSDAEQSTRFQRYRDVWECVRCGRLAIEFPKGTRDVKWYSPDDGQTGYLMRRATT